MDFDEWVEAVLETQPPFISKPTKHMLFVVKCSQCSYENSDVYQRQNPDCLRLLQWCPECHADLILVDAIPNTCFYWSHSCKHATFCDDVAGECWHCSRKKGPLHLYTFSNGQCVELCRKDFTHYHKNIWRVNEQRAQYFASEPPDDDALTDPTQLKSFDVPVDVDPFDEFYELP
jgi:hypothetical protein